MSRNLSDHLMPEPLREQAIRRNRKERIADFGVKYWPLFVIAGLCIGLGLIWSQPDPNRDPAAGFEAAETLRAVGR